MAVAKHVYHAPEGARHDRIGKLYKHVSAHPRATLAFRDFIRLVEALGFVLVRQNGSHRCFEHPRCPDLLVVQPRGAEAKPYQVQQFLDMVIEHGLSLD